MATSFSPQARWRRTATVAAMTLLLPASWAQTSERVTVTGRSIGAAQVAGFGDTPPASAPLQTSVFGNQQLADAGVNSLAGLTRLDASLGDAYNAEGYWAILSSRGYTLDNRFNYRRDGLPINAETALALENKERLELIKGTTGVQAGTSAPGGLVNLIVKRPAGSIRTARIDVRQRGSVLGTVDLGERFGAEGVVGVRLNLAHERLDPQVRDSRGERSLAALAVDWQVNADNLLQLEGETSRQRQPSVAGFSLLGDHVPDPSSIDRRRNLNAQPWSQPVVMNGETASVRWQTQLRSLGEGWRVTAQAMTQRLHSDDRTAFPYGKYDANYECAVTCDRFARDGSFTYWEYISDHERRTTHALSLTLAGTARTGPVEHQFETGVLRTRYQGQFQDQVFDIAGTGRIDGTLQTARSAGFGDANTNRDEHSLEWFARDAMRIGDLWQLWAGLRHTQINRSGVRTSPDSEGSLRATNLERNATTPWLALAARLTPRTLLYASWGSGLEADVAPNRARFTNPGATIELQSRQVEVGLKHGTDHVEAAVTLFDIDRGQTSDIGACGGAGTCTRVSDGSARHRGIEAQWMQRVAAWTWQASAMWLQAERRGARDAAVNGQRPVNVPEGSLRLGAEYRPGAVPGLALLLGLSAEGNRVVLPYDTTVRIAAWQRWDAGLRWSQPLGSTTVTWRAAVDNLTDARAWKESPYQFGHVYLYPLAPRTLRASASASF
jgi:iron complex outermembrane recepter protein